MYLKCYPLNINNRPVSCLTVFFSITTWQYPSLTPWQCLPLTKRLLADLENRGFMHFMFGVHEIKAGFAYLPATQTYANLIINKSLITISTHIWNFKHNVVLDRYIHMCCTKPSREGFKKASYKLRF